MGESMAASEGVYEAVLLRRTPNNKPGLERNRSDNLNILAVLVEQSESALQRDAPLLVL